MQNIVEPWFDMYGACYYVRYFAVAERKQKKERTILRICCCTIAEYQELFVKTYNNPCLLKWIDYWWTGALFKARRCDIDFTFRTELASHERFSRNRDVNAKIELEPQNALHFGLQLISEKTMSILRENWSPPPKNFSTAINWKAYDYWYFSSFSFWPGDNKSYGPKDEILSKPRLGLI